MASAPEMVLDLVERFRHNSDYYHRPDYNETQVRREFIDPLFMALGWDVDNRRGVAPRYQEVIHEASLRDRGAVLSPDYCFRMGPEARFYVEAKKPAVDIRSDIQPAYQLRSYAWTKKLPLSILTDFEEFSVYDCLVPPKATDKAASARVMYVRCEEYPERWEEIAAIFSREAVLRGDYDRYAETARGKRGTQEVDDVFLQEIEEWCVALARNIALRNPSLTVRALNYAVQQTIDRIIFLRICEDRGIEPYEQLKDALAGGDIYPRLMELFDRADERYNSGLFHFRREKGREDPDTLTPHLRLDDKVLSDIITKLYYPHSPYAFEVLSVDILGNVYERFLGSVIRLTAGHQAKVEQKPEVRKAGGVYYTPKYIVDYIVQHTVGVLCEGKTPGEIAKLRILDPACGSGSFLLGAYQYLLDYHLNWYVEHPTRQARREVYQGRGGDWFLTTEEKKRILLNNIHGVDIDPQAVEVTKLSLLLKVLEGENQETIAEQMRLWQERALPDLSHNIKCGNSLIGPDFYERQQPGLLDEEETYRVNAFDWEKEFAQIMREGGFDAVIGNPPYIRIHRIDHDIADYLFRVYKTPSSKTDISLSFLEKALTLLSNSGLAGFICTSQWLNTDYGRNMRQLLSDGKLHEIVDFGSLPVFQTADTYPAIFTLSKGRADRLRYKKIQSNDQLNLLDIERADAVLIGLETLSEKPWSFGKIDIPTILGRSGIVSEPLRAFGQAYIGLLTGMDEAFVVDQEMARQMEFEEDIVLPYAYRGAEVRRYSEVKPNARVIYPYKEGTGGAPEVLPESQLRAQYPHIYGHLLSYKDALRKRQDSRRFYASGPDWYRHLRPGSFNYVRPGKLIIKGIDTRTTVGVLDVDTAFNGANCPGIILDKLGNHSPHYILALLNSKVVSYHLRMVCPPKLGGYTRFNANNINDAPIRVIAFDSPADVSRHDQMVVLVERMLDLHKRLAAAQLQQEKTMLQRQIEATDKQIDLLVYELYGLTEEEIRVVEGAQALPGY